MAIIQFESNLYTAFKFNNYDGNLAANINSQASLVLVDTVYNPSTAIDVYQLRLRKGFEIDWTPSPGQTDSILTCIGGHLHKGGVATGNDKLQAESSLKQYVDPTYVRIDIDALMNQGIPEQTDITFQMEEGFLVEDKYKYPSALGYALPQNNSYLTMRTPARAIARNIAISSSINPDFPYRLRYFNNDNNQSVYSLFTPSAFAVGNFVGEIASGMFILLNTTVGAIYPIDLDPEIIILDLDTDNSRARYLIENAVYSSQFSWTEANLVRVRTYSGNDLQVTTALAAEGDGLTKGVIANLLVQGFTLIEGQDVRLMAVDITASSTLTSAIEVFKVMVPTELTLSSSLECEASEVMRFEIDRSLLSSGTSISVSVPPKCTIEIDWGDSNSETHINTSLGYYSLNHTYSQNNATAMVKLAIIDTQSYGYTRQLKISSNQSNSYVTILGIHSYGDAVFLDGYEVLVPTVESGWPNNFFVPSGLPDGVTSLNSLFENLQGFDDVGITTWDTSNITSMIEMFKNAREMDQDISGWDVSNVTNMHGMFYNANNFNNSVNAWDVSNVTNMNYMFSSCAEYNKPMNLWSCDSLTNALGFLSYARKFNSAIFTNAPLLANVVGFFQGAFLFNDISIQNFPIGNVGITSLNKMFWDARAFNQDISGWDTSKVTNMSGLFGNDNVADYQKCAFNQNINAWDVSNVTNFSEMFKYSLNFQQDITWDLGSSTSGAQPVNCYRMFNASEYNGQLNGMGVSRVLNFEQMFKQSTFNQPLNNWTLNEEYINGTAITFNEMFYDNHDFNQDIGDWNTYQVNNFNSMFRDARAFNQDLSDWWVYTITGVPSNFSTNDITGVVPLSAANTPDWGGVPTSAVSSRTIKDVNLKSGGATHWYTGLGAKIGSHSLRMVASSSLNESINLTTHTDFGFGTGEFCVEFWWYAKDEDYASGNGPLPDETTLFDMRTSVTDTNAIRIALDNSNNDDTATLAAYIRQANGTTTAMRIAVNQVTHSTWYHIAFQRNSSGTVKLYVNGFGGNASMSASSIDLGTTRRLNVGSSTAVVQPGFFEHYVDEIRISDIARYTTNFTPATYQSGPHINDSNTLLLIHGDRVATSTIIVDDARN
tara:strand:+ start:17 stop:3343 length:3327 start_codon:yes stop_codon:yes gene_type:complete